MDTYKSLLVKFKEQGIENAVGDLTEIISYVSGRAFDEIVKLRLYYCTSHKDLLDAFPDEKQRIVALSYKRLEGTPVQYLTNRSYFYGLEFFVNESVLIPRFDTECIVDEAVHIIKDEPLFILDLCSGSGCIGVSIASFCKNVKVVFADISEQALKIARMNAERYGIEATYLKQDVFNRPQQIIFDMVISNPPYVSMNELGFLSSEVKKEPISALYGGEDGLDFYRQIAYNYKNNIVHGGYLLFEHGAGQSNAVMTICQEAGYFDIYAKNDLNGLNRVVVARNI